MVEILSLTHSTPLTRHCACRALAEWRHLHQYHSIVSIIRISQSVKQPPSQGNQAISQAINQSINTQPQQPQQAFNNHPATTISHIYLSHINSNDLSFSANHSFSLSPPVIMSILTAQSCTFSHSREMHTSHNNIAHSNLWLTSYTLTEFCMLLCLIPSVTLQVSHGDVTVSIFHATVTPLNHAACGWFLSLLQLSRNLSRNNLRSIHLCYSLNLCASCAPMLSHDCYPTSHSFRAHAPSHDSLALSPFLTQLSIPIPISHAIFARSLTLPSSSNLSRNLYCSLSHMHTGRGRTWRSMTRPCPWSILAKYDWSDHPGAHPLPIRVRSTIKLSKMWGSRTFSYFDTTYVNSWN